MEKYTEEDIRFLLDLFLDEYYHKEKKQKRRLRMTKALDYFFEHYVKTEEYDSQTFLDTGVVIDEDTPEHIQEIYFNILNTDPSELRPNEIYIAKLMVMYQESDIDKIAKRFEEESGITGVREILEYNLIPDDFELIVIASTLGLDFNFLAERYISQGGI